MSNDYVSSAVKLVESAPRSQIRNICIIAHVDHGKTTLSDFLLASNKHISARQLVSGQKTGEAIRFLDSRMDEIDRQITIKSSCISLVWKIDTLINLIDSPGHVDFAAEVSAAARLTDGCVLVVDCVEGVCAQTFSVIVQSWENFRIIPILFINKLDKLIELIPNDFSQVFSRICKLIENVNLIYVDLIEKEKERRVSLGLELDFDAGKYQFDPVGRGNVLFGSALHGWAFDLRTWTDKLLHKHTTQDLYPYMFGDFQLNSEKKIIPSTKTTLFGKFVLEQIWNLYTANQQVKLSQMFPVSDAVLGAVFTHVPPPSEGLAADVTTTTVFVAKDHPADLDIQCLLGDRVDNVRKLNGFVGIARVCSGAVFPGQQLFVAGTSTVATVDRVYLLMGSSLVSVSRAVAGCVCGLVLSGRDSWGGSTLSTDSQCVPFPSPYQLAQAIVRVTVGVKKSANELILQAGLRLLSRSDPAVVVTRHPQTGEDIVGCCGDEHLSRCVQDLQQLFAPGIELLVSEPIVEIRETLDVAHTDEPVSVPAWLSDFSHVVRGNSVATCASPDGACLVTVCAKRLAEPVLEWIGQWQTSLRSLFHERRVVGSFPFANDGTYESCVTGVFNLMNEKLGIANVVDMHVKNEAFCVLTGACADDGVKFGFQQACMSGPLSEEPIRGVEFRVIDLVLDGGGVGSISWATSFACKSAMIAGAIRISEPLLKIELQTEHVGATQGILSQRRADIYHSDLVEGSYSEYLIKATLPASDAFRVGEKSKQTFADELRGATHGKIIWKLGFSHWVVVDGCPFTAGGIAHKIVCGVRKRKGLSIGEKVVADADKQRTLTKMK